MHNHYKMWYLLNTCKMISRETILTASQKKKGTTLPFWHALVLQGNFRGIFFLGAGVNLSIMILQIEEI